jgi:uncharacterized protein YhfF
MEKDYEKFQLYEWNFGDDKKLADCLKELVLAGKKTATTGLWRENKKIPTNGDYAAILDSDGKRFCIIRYINVEVKPFLEVGYEFIKKEGEGDPDVESWRKGHRGVFRRWSNSFTDASRVVCEEFEVVDRL